MSTTEQTMTTAQATDTEIARLMNERDALLERVAANHSTILGAAGARYYYRGKKHVTDMKVEDAIALVKPQVDAADSEYARIESYNAGQVGKAIAFCLAAGDEFERIALERHKLEQVRTDAGGWSRFFVVTSSAGHIHSSTSCSTCRMTTTFGWLPPLSGLNVGDAVAAHGPALCSVCFPSAPVRYIGGKLTKAAAVKVAA